MARIARFLVLAATLPFAAPGSPSASPAAATTTQYSLIVPPSSLQAGCFGPCDCAVQDTPTYGSFVLVPAGTDPLYTYYEVQNYIASFNNGPGAVAITGSGRYKIGGEVALTQEMTLDLQVWGGPVQHFDSGVVPVSTPFPAIDVSCAIHGFACEDSVVVVDAKPPGTTGVSPPRSVSGIASVRPNPFDRSTSIVLGLDRTGPAEVEVFDMNGRQVRRLGSLELLDSAPRTLVWDGRRDDGREAKAGVYWVRMRWPGGSDRRRVVKLD